MSHLEGRDDSWFPLEHDSGGGSKMAVNQPPEWKKLRQDLTYDPLGRTQKVADKWITNKSTFTP